MFFPYSYFHSTYFLFPFLFFHNHLSFLPSFTGVSSLVYSFVRSILLLPFFIYLLLSSPIHSLIIFTMNQPLPLTHHSSFPFPSFLPSFLSILILPLSSCYRYCHFIIFIIIIIIIILSLSSFYHYQPIIIVSVSLSSLYHSLIINIPTL